MGEQQARGVVTLHDRFGANLLRVREHRLNNISHSTRQYNMWSVNTLPYVTSCTHNTHTSSYVSTTSLLSLSAQSDDAVGPYLVQLVEKSWDMLLQDLLHSRQVGDLMQCTLVGTSIAMSIC